MIIPYNYPFIPVQLTLTNALTIGIPSFILALEPNKKKVTGNFLTNVFKKAIPTSFIIVLSIRRAYYEKKYIEGADYAKLFAVIAVVVLICFFVLRGLLRKMKIARQLFLQMSPQGLWIRGPPT